MLRGRTDAQTYTHEGDDAGVPELPRVHNRRRNFYAHFVLQMCQSQNNVCMYVCIVCILMRILFCKSARVKTMYVCMYVRVYCMYVFRCAILFCKGARVKTMVAHFHPYILTSSTGMDYAKLVSFVPRPLEIYV